MFHSGEEGFPLSRVSKIVPIDNFPTVLNLILKSALSLMYDGIFLTSRPRWKSSTKREMPSVGVPQDDTIGLPGFLGLWILGRM